MGSPGLQRHRRNREGSQVHGPGFEEVMCLVAETLDCIGISPMQRILHRMGRELVSVT